MKKVLFAATVDSHIKQFHLPYLQWFKEQGYEVHVATNGDEEIPYCDIKHRIPFERNPIKVNNLNAIKKLKKIIENEKFELIHCHTPMGSVITRLASKKSRKKFNTKVIYTAHGFHFYKGAPLLNWIIYYPIEKILSNITDCLITINEEDYEIAKRKLKTKKITLVHGVGVDFSKFNFEMSEEEKIALKENLGLRKNDYIIIYPAELSKRKNQEMLLKAIDLLKKDNYKNIRVLLPGIDSMNGKYEKIAKRLNIEKDIRFLGYRNDIPKLMKISDLAVSTSKQEGLPVNIIEAMMANLPIIATDCRGNRDLVGEKNIVKINNEKMLKEKIEEIYKKGRVAEKYENLKIFEKNEVLKCMEEIYEEYI